MQWNKSSLWNPVNLSTDRASLWNPVNLLTDAMKQSISMKSCKSLDRCNGILHLYEIL